MKCEFVSAFNYILFFIEPQERTSKKSAGKKSKYFSLSLMLFIVCSTFYIIKFKKNCCTILIALFICSFIYLLVFTN